VASRWTQTDAGEYFFEALAGMQQEPGRYANVLEIFHRCLAMGFEGRYRVNRDRTGDVEGVRKSVARTLAELAGPPEPTLSPHWAGVAVAARSPGTIVPPWVIWTTAAALLLAIYTGFRYRIASYSEQLGPLVADLPPAVTPSAAAVLAPMPALPAPRTVLDPGFLAEEQRQGLVTVQESAQRVLIRLTAPDLFAPGSDQIATARRALVDRIGQELASRPGRILVTGYTDNVPLRRSPRFASNQELSEARATLIGNLLAGPLQGKGRVTTTGKGDAEPIASNATPDGRARNRRVEIVLLKVAGS
jgi:type VI secretion system protein ImpK